MPIVGIDHVQLAMPQGGEARARVFYAGLLGLGETARPPALAGRPGVWFENDRARLHLGVEADFRPARKAHPGLRTQGYFELVERLEAAGYPVVHAETLAGMRRSHVFDPFGNQLVLGRLRQRRLARAHNGSFLDEATQAKGPAFAGADCQTPSAPTPAPSGAIQGLKVMPSRDVMQRRVEEDGLLPARLLGVLDAELPDKHTPRA
ncbi:MAG TPA: hypothetical protein VF989_13810 [Polyangiaceae bacterium]